MDVRMRMTTIGMVLQLCSVLRVFVPQARPSGTVCSEHQPSCLPRVPSLVCRNVDASLGGDETLQLWRKKLFETTLHLTKFVADSRRVFHKSSFWRPRRLVQGLFLLVPLVLPPDTIESDDELHR